jgi:competence protein ComEC
LTGLTLHEIATYTEQQNHIIHLATNEEVEVRGKVLQVTTSWRENSLIVKPYSILKGGEEISPVFGKIKVTLRGSKETPKYGDLIRFREKLQLVNFPKHKGSFDYRTYLARRDIYALAFADEELIKLGKNEGNSIFKFALGIRQKITEILQLALPTPSNSILISILLGEKDSLPPQIKKEFFRSGVGHVLCVSGLHVGFIGLILFSFFRWLLRFPNKITSILTIGGLILYALITGLRPSVIRATLMAVVALLSFVMERYPHPYNSLALAAFLILLFKPNLLFCVGFQLSFLTVGGILYFTPRIYSLFKKFTPKFIGSALSVSLAASLSAWPLLAYHFNKVPLIAVLSNLIVIPIVSVVLYIGFIILFASTISWKLVEFISPLNSFLISILLGLVHSFSNLPYSTISTPKFSPVFVVLYYTFGIIALETYFALKSEEDLSYRIERWLKRVGEKISFFRLSCFRKSLHF